MPISPPRYIEFVIKTMPTNQRTTWTSATSRPTSRLPVSCGTSQYDPAMNVNATAVPTCVWM